MQLSAISLALTRIGYISGAYSPSSLFAANEQGLWLDPSDFSTMFQDAAGTTPVTAVEQPVGLLLDKSKSLALGSELVDTANLASAWIAFNSNIKEQDGDAVKVTYVDQPRGAHVYLSATHGTIINLDTSKTYKLTYQVKVSVGASANVEWSGGSGIGVAITSNEFITQEVIGRPSSAAGTYLTFANLSSGEQVWIQSISVREVTGNHASQSTTTKRPVLSARYNLLTKTEDFSHSDWTKAAVSITPDAITASDGTLTADLILETVTNTTHRINKATTIIDGTPVKATIRFKQHTVGRNLRLLIQSGSNYVITVFSSADGTILSQTDSLGSIFSNKVNYTSAADSYGFYTVGISANTAGTTSVTMTMDITDGTNGSYAGDITKGIYIWGASLVPTSQASLPYQRVNTATDYDTVGFLPYLKFDGIDDALATSAINFSATDSMSVFAGLRKLSDAAEDILVELSATSLSNAGTFNITAPYAASASYSFTSKGTASGVAVASTGYAAPITNVLTGIGDISSDTSILRINGVEIATDATDQGTGNYGNYALYIGGRAGTSLYFNGNLYSLIIRGAASTATQITNTESWVNGKTGAY